VTEVLNLAWQVGPFHQCTWRGSMGGDFCALYMRTEFICGSDIYIHIYICMKGWVR
jgi:hypothetical protein